MSDCVHDNGEYCEVISDKEVRQPCLETPLCEKYKAIVYCKDCKYFSQNDRWCDRYECGEGCGSICWDLGEDGFCSKAEERIYCKDCKYFKLGKCYWRGDFEEAEKMNGVEIIREYPQPTNVNDWCGNGEKMDEVVDQ